MKDRWQQLLSGIKSVMIFQQRIWVVSIGQGAPNDETFTIHEDDFDEPMQWMKRKGYTPAMIAQVEKMRRSQTLLFQLGDVQHRLLRVK